MKITSLSPKGKFRGLCRKEAHPHDERARGKKHGAHLGLFGKGLCLKKFRFIPADGLAQEFAPQTARQVGVNGDCLRRRRIAFGQRLASAGLNLRRGPDGCLFSFGAVFPEARQFSYPSGDSQKGGISHGKIQYRFGFRHSVGTGPLLNLETGEELASAVCDYPHGVMDREMPGGEAPPDWARSIRRIIWRCFTGRFPLF